MGLRKVRLWTSGVGVSGCKIGSLAFSIRSSLVSLYWTVLFGQGTTMLSPGMIRLKDFRPVLGSMNVRERSSLSMTTLSLVMSERLCTSTFLMDD